VFFFFFFFGKNKIKNKKNSKLGFGSKLQNYVFSKQKKKFKFCIDHNSIFQHNWERTLKSVTMKLVIPLLI